LPTTRQRMIERTAVLLAKKGLQGTSFSEVLEASGAPRGSLYHYFPGGKNELVLEAVAFAGARAIGVLDGLTGKPAGEVAEAFFALWRWVLSASDFNAGCAVAAVTVAAEEPALLARAAEVFRAWRTQLAGLLEAGGIPAGHAPALAATLVSAAEGAVILARAEHAFEPFDLVAAEMLARVADSIE
jgi:TetR/AcrR family transcriptional repressor of lmrAB and yxaGH operons